MIEGKKVCLNNTLFTFFVLGDTVFISGAASTPMKLALAMTEHGKKNNLKDVVVCHMHTEGAAPYTDPEAVGKHIKSYLYVYCSPAHINTVHSNFF